ncbi:MAG: flagellar filament capping protein FliD [Candidatus Scalindua sp.]
MAGISSVGGLVSGLDTATIVEQLIAVSRKRIDVVASNQTTYGNKLEAYQSLNTQLSSFQSKADILRDVDTFNVFKNVTTTDSTTFSASDLLSVSTTTDAAAGTHTIRFTSSSQLAQARKLSSESYTDYDTALGISGEFIINGKAISVDTTDSLVDITSSINNANSGTDSTGVTASILSVSSTDNRLVLTSDNTGEDEFSILDASASNILQTLGFTTTGTDGDGISTTIKNTTSDGAESDALSSSSAAVGSLLGLTSAQSGTVTIGTYTRTIDLSTDSLSAIASTIDGMTGITATVEPTTTDDGVTTYYIDISGTTTFSDNNNVLETLGILEGTNGSVNEIHAGSVANTDGGAAISGTSTFDQISGASVSTIDTITIQGTNSDGTAITTDTFNIYSGGSYSNIDGLLTAIESAYGGTSYVDAYISDGTDGNTAGQIAIQDVTAGDSQLSLTLITNNEGGGSLDFGTIEASTEGYDMQVTAGQDANVEIDGVAITQSSNSIDDVISGVTIDLTRVETDDTTVNLTISRDTDSIKSSINNFITEYNSIIEFINQQFTYDEDTESSGELAGESILYTIKSTIQSTITSTNSLLSGDYDALSLIGITSDIKGKLSLDNTDFLSAINTDFNAVKRLFTAEGTTTDSEITYINHTEDTVQGDYAIVINTVATQATVTGTSDIFSGIGGGNTETITITDTVTNRVATIALDGDTTTGDTLDSIVNTINSELANEYTEILVGDNAQTAGGSAITSSDLLNDIDGSTLTTDDIIQIEGTTRSGIDVSNSYTIDDLSTTTVQDFLSFIEDTYNNEVSATIDTSGNLVITENTVGDSQLSIAITDEDGDPLPAGLGVDFGTISTTVEGRYAMEITASASGNNLAITHDIYGSDHGFTTDEANDLLGTEGTYEGVDVAGTINGEAATGSGQILVGDAPGDGDTTSIERLSIKVTSTNESLVGSVANTTDGTTAITDTTLFSAINGATVASGDTISVSGTQHDGTDVVSYDYTITPISTVTVGDFLDDIELNFGLSAGSVTIDSSGQISIEDSYDGVSQLGITLVESSAGLDFGTITPGSKGDVKLTIGVAEEIYRELDFFTDQYDGLVTIRMDGLKDTIDDIQDTITGMKSRLVMEQMRLENQFVQLEMALAKLQTMSSFLARQLNSLSSS